MTNAKYGSEVYRTPMCRAGNKGHDFCRDGQCECLCHFSERFEGNLIDAICTVSSQYWSNDSKDENGIPLIPDAFLFIDSVIAICAPEVDAQNQKKAIWNAWKAHMNYWVASPYWSRKEFLESIGKEG